MPPQRQPARNRRGGRPRRPGAATSSRARRSHRSRASSRAPSRATARPARRGGTRKSTVTSSLTKAQQAQRRYASAMRGVRARANATPGGRGPIALRPAARALRRKLGLRRR